MKKEILRTWDFWAIVSIIGFCIGFLICVSAGVCVADLMEGMW